MTILIIGKKGSQEECCQRLGDSFEYRFSEDYAIAGILPEVDVVFDFVSDPASVSIFKNFPRPVFLNTATITLLELIGVTVDVPRFGFNGLPGFVVLPALETTKVAASSQFSIEEIASILGLRVVQVDDRVGMVTPRIVCMIINEAYYTVQEGTASRQDIDLAMKLGTNYPYGPFEWCEKIGIASVYRVLKRMHEDTGDVRYKICPLLKKEYLKSLQAY